jgi:sodium pump decarboxylase gamma subunit
MNFSNVFSTGGMVTGIGLLIVFTVLIALIAIMFLLPKLAKLRNAKTGSATTVKKAKPAAPKPETASQPAREKRDDGELVAVLAASVAAMMDTQPGNIVIHSYKRISPSSWRKSGRDYQIFNKI